MEECFRFLQVFVCFACLGFCLCSVTSKHECNRVCEEDKPMTCEYNFTIETYYVLSKACYECPFNQTDCFRPDCISTNGKQRTLMSVNRQMPGTSIEVCKGDTVVVYLDNKMEDGMSTSIHWHGLFQQNSCPMDGVAMLTQCSIPPYEVFRYEFTAEPAGTHWWHSHSGLQMGEGLTGAFIVREPLSQEPHSDLYDEDLSDHVMLINDWTDVDFMEIYEGEMHDQFKSGVEINALVNGHGEKHVSKDDDDNEAYTPVETFNIDKGKKYRFRLIGAMVRCWFIVSIDNHTLNVIATDGMPVKPVTVDSIGIHPGERYDFVLDADQEVKNYWVKLQGMGQCANDGHGYAILHYNGFKGKPRPKGDPKDFSTQDGIVLNPSQTKDEYDEDDILPIELRYGGEDQNFEDEEVDLKYYIGLTFLQNDNTRYNRRDLYPVKNLPGGRRHSTPTLNNITLFRPPVPLVTQWNDAIGRITICNYNSMDTRSDCDDDLCYCTHMLDVELGQVVELFLVGYTGPHPMHLHGQDYRVVAAGKLENAAASIEEIKAMDEAGEFPRVLINPVRKDTLTIFGEGGYSVMRFKAINPGVWFFHCHNEGHFMQGMAMLIKVGKPEEFPKPPSWFPKCGGYDYQSKAPLQTSQNSATDPEDTNSFPIVYVLAGAGLLVAMLLVVIIVLTRKLYSRKSGYIRLRT